MARRKPAGRSTIHASTRSARATADRSWPSRTRPGRRGEKNEAPGLNSRSLKRTESMQSNISDYEIFVKDKYRSTRYSVSGGPRSGPALVHEVSGPDDDVLNREVVGQLALGGPGGGHLL